MIQKEHIAQLEHAGHTLLQVASPGKVVCGLRSVLAAIGGRSRTAQGTPTGA